MTGKKVLITGATDGLGKRLARSMASKGATVLLHGRNPEKGQSVLEEIKRDTGNNNIVYYNADFASLAEIRQLGREIRENHDKLDLLINNAGIGFGKPNSSRSVSRDGYELRFQVNYLSGFMLTLDLLPLLQNTPSSRIVNVASIAQQPLDFENLMLEEGWSGYGAYAQSKLAQIMFTFELAERLKNTTVSVNTLHPATYMDTNMVREAEVTPKNDVSTGTEAVEFLALSPDLDGVSGTFFNGKVEAPVNEQAYDSNVRQQLWQVSEELTGVNYLRSQY